MERDTLLDSLTTAVVFLDVALRVRRLNNAAENLLGVSRRQACGAGIEQFVFDLELLGLMRQTVRQGVGFTDRERTIRVQRGARVVDCILTPRYRGTEVGGVTLELHDIDRYVRISREEALWAQQQAAHALLRSMAHEVKNPLGGLRGAAQLSPSDVRSGGRDGHSLCNAHQAMERVRALLTVEAAGRVQVVTDYDPSIPDAPADLDQLIQALLNLGRNALEALQGQPEGRIVLRTGVSRHFTIGNRRHRLVLRLEVEDNGPGIPAALKDNIFLPLITSKPEGSGLGLPIAQSLAAQHGGLIECDSAPGRTVFTLFLPVNGGSPAVENPPNPSTHQEETP